mmetsp:Transcript_1217/g.3602  ORF Transcript_1217/g.3602 Transcript_1217/m.3602 type:complete len:261 (-) Transcript_1217:1750-2532(-)
MVSYQPTHPEWKLYFNNNQTNTSTRNGVPGIQFTPVLSVNSTLPRSDKVYNNSACASNVRLDNDVQAVAQFQCSGAPSRPCGHPVQGVGFAVAVIEDGQCANFPPGCRLVDDRMRHVDKSLPTFFKNGRRSCQCRRNDRVLGLYPGRRQQLLCDGRERQHLDAVDVLHVGAKEGAVRGQRPPQNAHDPVFREWLRVDLLACRLDLPVFLGGSELHGQQEAPPVRQLLIPPGQPHEVHPVVSVHRLAAALLVLSCCKWHHA